MAVVGACLMATGMAGADMGSSLSTWTAEEVQGLPNSFWAIQQRKEREWPAYIHSYEQQFAKLYGPGARNSYALFLKEQNSMGGDLSQPVLQRKFLKRLVDLVSLPGKTLAGLKGSPLAQVRVVAYRENALRVIPYDVLEFTSSGRVVLPAGPEANPQDGDGVLGDNDRLFCMAMDAGHRIGKPYIASVLAGVKEIQEIEIAYTPEQERGWVYVVSFTGNPPARAGLDYVKIAPEGSIMYSPFMLVQSKPRRDGKGVSATADVCTLAVAPSLGGKPCDIHHKLNLNIKTTYRMGVTTQEDKDSFNMRFRAWFDGETIVYGRCAWKVKTPLGIGAPTIFVDVMFNPFTLLSQCYLGTPFDPSALVKQFCLGLGEEMNKQALPQERSTYRVITADNRQGNVIDAQMNGRELSQDKKGLKKDLWHVLTGPWGSMCVFAGLNDYLAQHAGDFRMVWTDTPEHIGGYTYNLAVGDFKNRQEHMYLEWNALPFLSEGGQYNWKNLDLVLKHREKPLTYTIEGQTRMSAPRFIADPNIKQEKPFYRY